MKSKNNLLIISILLISLLATPYQARAILKQDRKAVTYDHVFPQDSIACVGGAGQATGGNLPSDIPAVWRNLIMGVAPKYPDVDPRLVAAVLWAENRGWPEYKSSGWGVSPAEAAGPWQFIPETWAVMGTDGDGDGRKDRENPKDAVHGAFKHHKGSSGLKIAEEFDGNAESSFPKIVYKTDLKNLLHFVGKYNGSGAPVGVKLKDFPVGTGLQAVFQNGNYVIMGYWLLATNFKKGWNPETRKFVDASSSKPGGGNATTTPGEVNACASADGGGVNSEGYAFPVSPQRKSQNGGVAGMSALPCPRSVCHHDGTPAFDISRKPGGDAAVGTPVYAINEGKILYIRDNYKGNKGCFSIQLKAKDEFIYWHGHLANPTVRDGQSVKAGDQIAEIGKRACTGNGSDPHLHIDRGCVKNGVHQPGGRESCRDEGINELMNSIFEGLPE